MVVNCVHDPLVVAFAIVRPWPQRTSFSATGSRGDGVRWRMRLFHDCGTWCADDPPHRRGAFPWWKSSSYSRFWRVAGRDIFWPALVTVWHREPGGHDSGEVCPHYRRWKDDGGEWQSKVLRGWKWHVRHWKIQLHPAQQLRRRLLTRCVWCHGRPRKRSPVNVSRSWENAKQPWWRGEAGLYHADCLSVAEAHEKCLCLIPGQLSHGDYGRCATCTRFRAWQYEPDEADRLLAALPHGSRITADVRPAIEAAWAARRARREAADAREAHHGGTAGT